MNFGDHERKPKFVYDFPLFFLCIIFFFFILSLKAITYIMVKFQRWVSFKLMFCDLLPLKKTVVDSRFEFNAVSESTVSSIGYAFNLISASSQ